MLDELLADGFKIKKCIMDQDASCQDVLLSKSPETEIIICGNHKSKTFHIDLENVKKTPCQKTVDGKPYTTKHVFNCSAQLKSFKNLLERMASRAEEYVTLDGQMTTNTTEGYHSIALIYRDKRIDLGSIHYTCKTNMSIPHKVEKFIMCNCNNIITMTRPDQCAL
ncbi:hypothetical protein QZH41_015520 [Actinostola sp. cb2023]|nr:hypothetical protein QZH41_015520 [Actinostola sp. cb2023]